MSNNFYFSSLDEFLQDGMTIATCPHCGEPYGENHLPIDIGEASDHTVGQNCVDEWLMSNPEFASFPRQIAECEICREKYDGENHLPLQLLRCGHIYGEECSTGWFSRNSESGMCPTCRMELFGEAQIPSDEEDNGPFWTVAELHEYRDSLWEFLKNPNDEEAAGFVEYLHQETAGRDMRQQFSQNWGSFTPEFVREMIFGWIRDFWRTFRATEGRPGSGILQRYQILLYPTMPEGARVAVQPLVGFVMLLMHLNYVTYGAVRDLDADSKSLLFDLAEYADFSEGVKWEVFERAAALRDNRDWVPLAWLSFLICHDMTRYDVQEDYRYRFFMQFVKLGRLWSGDVSQELVKLAQAVTHRLFLKRDNPSSQHGRYLRLQVGREEMFGAWSNGRGYIPRT